MGHTAEVLCGTAGAFMQVSYKQSGWCTKKPPSKAQRQWGVGWGCRDGFVMQGGAREPLLALLLPPAPGRFRLPLLWTKTVCGRGPGRC